MLRQTVHFLDALNGFVTKAAMWLIVPLVGIMLYDVILRYVFNAPTLWGVELSTMIFGLYMIFAGPCSVMEKVQVGVDIFSSRWSPRTRAAVHCFTYGLTALLFASLIYTSYVYALESWEIREISSSAWGQPVYHWKALIPAAFILMLLQTFADFLRNLWHAATGKEME